MRKLLLTGLNIFVLCASFPATAYELSDTVELHGYGNAGYLQTSANQYLSGNRDGSWDYYAGALLLTATLSEKSKVWAQGFTSSEGPKRTHLDWLFVDYRANSGITLRAGQVKLPMGLYNEVRDIEFIQLSSLRPSIYQDASNIADEAFQGASILIEHDFGSGNMAWDFFTGRTVEYQTAEFNYSELFGGRLTYSPPIDGLKLMYSGHVENIEVIDTGEKGSEITSVFSVEYLNNSLDLKSEFAQKSSLGTRIISGYLQAGYHINNLLTPYIRCDYINTDLTRNDDPSYYQLSQTIGVGYKFNKSIGLRLESHFNHGYALPVASKEVAAGAGVTDWQQFAASVNFIF